MFYDLFIVLLVYVALTTNERASLHFQGKHKNMQVSCNPDC